MALLAARATGTGVGFPAPGASWRKGSYSPEKSEISPGNSERRLAHSKGALGTLSASSLQWVHRRIHKFEVLSSSQLMHPRSSQTKCCTSRSTLFGTPLIPPLSAKRCRSQSVRKLGKGVQASSEFWYEEEIEFDVNEIVRPKRIVLMRCAEHILDRGAALTQRGREQAAEARAACEQFIFQAAFCSPETAVEETADVMWEKRKGPPYFQKVRSRATLQGLGGTSPRTSETSATSSEAADVAAPHWDSSAESRLLEEAREFLKEVCTINWSTELTEGLGGGYLNPAKDREDILLVSHASSLAALAAAALQAPQVAAALVFDPGSLTILEYSGSTGQTEAIQPGIGRDMAVENIAPSFGHGLSGTFLLRALNLQPKSWP